MQAFAQAELELLGDPAMVDVTKYVNDPEYCANCASVEVGKTKCSGAYEYIVNEMVRPSIYSWVVGKRMVDICIPSKKLPATFQKSEQMMADIHGSQFHVSSEKMNKCFDKVEKSDRVDVQKKAVASYVHGLNKNIESLQKIKLKEMAALDSMLGQPAIRDVYCDKDKDLCNQLRACKGKGNEISETVDLSMTSLQEIVKLEEQKNDLRKHRYGKNRISNTDYKLAMEDVEQKIEFIKSMNPWLEGSELKGIQSDLKKLIKQEKQSDAQKLLTEKFTLQLEKTRELEKKEYIKLNTTQDCLMDNSFCSASILENMNKYYIQPDMNVYLSKKLSTDEIYEANVLKDAGRCMANLKSDKEGMDELNSIVASTTVGLFIGGVGGVFKLGQMALKFYEAGSRVKGLASIGALGLEAKMIEDTFTGVANSCSKAMNSIKDTTNGKSENICSDQGKNIFKVSNLKSCIADVAMTTLPYALSLRGLKGSIKALKAESAEVVKQEVEFIAKQIKNSVFSEVEKEEIAKALQRLDLAPDEMDGALTKINAIVKNELDKNRVKNYVNFVMSLKPEEQKLAINELQDIALLSSNMSPGTFVQKFYAKENKFYLYENFKAQSIKKDLLKAGKSEEEAIEASKVMARENRANLQKRFYSCQSKKVTPDHEKAAKRYMGISLALGIGGTVYGNYSNNTQKFENDKTEWFSKLGYDIAMTLIMTKINAKFVKNTGTESLASRYVTSNTNTFVVAGIDATVYSRLYGVSEAEAVTRLEQIKNSPTAMQELKVLNAYLEKNKVAESFEDKMINDYKKILGSKEKETILGAAPYQIGGETFSDLTPADLDKPAVREKLVHALVTQLNSGENGPLISTGDLGADRWVNDRVWNAAIGVPKSLVIGAGIYQILCLGIDRPFASLGAVTGIQFANQFVSGDAYYKLRKEMIGQ